MLLRLAAQSRSNMDDFTTGDYLDLSKARALGKMHLIKELKVKTTTVSHPTGEDVETHEIDVKLYDAQSATVQLGKLLGMYVDRVELTDWRSRFSDPQAALEKVIEVITPMQQIEAPATLPLEADLQKADTIDIPPSPSA